MILLIRYGSMELRTFWTNLNSIMILLIRLRSETFDASQDNLNSIMILLIPRMPLYFALFQSYLNSIMILLILNVTEIITGTRMLFKFHYDSINSMSELMKKYGYEKFKFHYDSINSYWLA